MKYDNSEYVRTMTDAASDSIGKIADEKAEDEKSPRVIAGVGTSHLSAGRYGFPPQGTSLLQAGGMGIAGLWTISAHLGGKRGAAAVYVAAAVAPGGMMPAVRRERDTEHINKISSILQECGFDASMYLCVAASTLCSCLESAWGNTAGKSPCGNKSYG